MNLRQTAREIVRHYPTLTRAKARILRQMVCNVRGTPVRLGVRSRTELMRAETYETKEPETLDWIDGFRSGELVFDVGANIGVYSLYAAKRGCEVYALEPAAENFASLVRNVRLNRLENIRPYCVGIGERSGVSLLHLTSLQPGDSQHQVGAANDAFGRGFVQVQGCAVFSLDDLCFAQGLAVPAHVKIDVDGLEPEIVRGADRLLRDQRLRSLLIEITRGAGETFDVQTFVEERGFTVKRQSREYVAGALRSRNYVFERPPG